MDEMIGYRVLVIDDEPVTGEMVKLVLMRCNDEVVTANTGEEGLELAEEDPPDLVILDISLPDMDGWSVYGRLRAMPDLWDVPILVTESRVVLEADHARAVGAAGCLFKPFHTAELLIARDMVLSGKTYYPSQERPEN